MKGWAKWSRAAGAAVLVLGTLTPLGASEATVPIEEVWQYDEILLLEAGFAIDADALIELATSHEDRLIRWKAVFVLGGRRERSAEAVLRAILANDVAFEVRCQAASALIRLGEADGLEALRELMASPDGFSTRLSIAAELAAAGDPSGFAHLEQILESGYKHREIVANALVSFVKAAREGKVDVDPCGLLVGLGMHESERVRRGAVVLFERAVIAGCEADDFESEAQILAAGDVDKGVREDAARALRLLRALRDAGGTDGSDDRTPEEPP